MCQDIYGDVLMIVADDRPLGRKLPTRLMCERYGVVDRTINRWEEAGVIPQAERINGRRYWDEEEVEKRDRERALTQTQKRQTKSPPTRGQPMNGESARNDVV
jgi:MerR HTH family regulatory protein